MRHLSLQLVFLLVLSACTTLAQQTPNSADDFSQRGISRFEKNELDGAIADFTKAIELNGQNLEFCFYFRGIALYRLGRLEDAIADLSKAISLKQHPRFYDDRGNLRAQKRDLDGAVDDLNKAIGIEPKYAKAYGDRALVRLMRGEDTAAELDFRKCFELDRTLESQFKSAASRLRQQASLRADYKKPSDVEVVKFTWKETPPAVPVSSKPINPISNDVVSPSGLRVLGNTTTTNQPGPPPMLDPMGTPVLVSRDYPAGVRGIYYKFTASIRNTGSKTIEAVEWAYVFYPKDRREPIAYVFATRANIPPGKDKNLTDQMLSMVNSQANSKLPTKDNRELFEERVVLLRLDYTDGSSWQTSGAVNNPKKTGPQN